MNRVFFHHELEGVATWWRVLRRDGVTLGFTSHDRDLRFDGILHRAAPGMLPSAIRRTADLELDSAEVSGALSHDSISATDLHAGRFDGAVVEIGLVDWEDLQRATLHRGEIGEISEEDGSFQAELRSAKAELELDLVPRTAPTCRAAFCGPGCSLSSVRFTREARLTSMDAGESRLHFEDGPPPAHMLGGSIRWLDGPHCGLTMQVFRADEEGLVVDKPLDPSLHVGARALLHQGCDHTLATCHARFANSVNFQGEPHLPGNDLIARYPRAGS
ncbi:putative phage protein (TIGR02218 family) [Altererythrobacter atlanticus]|uniref:Bacteriophage phiJL001 Gp84 C-terminal domain-containing protein n=1 Tax=Croceibacterium atlanticum TaxID=1267766 RepID=A0A0F7KV16_9SPHN|nr:DUF2163 domain-containing protein [Croceibacterium atlanticum]AKH43479.1 hypothetical protein WYH_02449 [Croceibacterium atlanticum]MBB5731813.1 putative phage protein (TIGR02218 family) [Croceibacterium atlanticum]